MLQVFNSLKDLTMSGTSDNDKRSDDEDIDGFIASVLQDIELKEAMNEGPEGSGTAVTAHQTQTNSDKNNNNNNSNNNNIQPQPLNKQDKQDAQNANNSHQVAPNSESAIANHAAAIKNVSHRKHSVKHRSNLKSCVKKIGHILSEVDEDKNGEIDYEEFQEGIRNIDSNLLPHEIEEIYQHFVWNEFDELNIKLFINLLFQRCKKMHLQKNISPKYILNIAFKSDVFRDKSPPPLRPLPSTNNNDTNNENKLNKIYDILVEKDDDNNLFIDWNEFEEAMTDLGVRMSRNNLKLIYKILIKKQENNNQELNIKKFLLPLSTLKCIESMEANQILQQYFEPMIPMSKKMKKYNFNHPLRHKNRKKRKHFNTISSYSHADISYFEPIANQMNTNKLKHNRYASLTNIDNVSIMNKANCSLIVLSALKQQLTEVDEDADNKIDYQEFNEVLLSLKSSFSGIHSYRIFYNLVEEQQDELCIDKFVAEMKHYFKLYPQISGDECIEKISNSNNKKINSMSHNFSYSMSSTQSSTQSIISMLDEEEKHIKDRNVINNISNIAEIEEIINQCDCDDNGLIDKEQFIGMLVEWRIAEKFDKNEMDIIYNELLVDSDEASCDLFMDKIHEIYRHHPNYSARKAVYRVCKRLIKGCIKHK